MSVKDKLADAGKAVGDAAKAVGQKVAEAGANAVDFVKDKTGIGHAKDQGIAAIKEHMPVYSSCGKQIGKVDKVEDGKIKLTKDSSPDGQHHMVPVSWVDRVDSHVHLNKNSSECEAGMKNSGTCGC